MAVKDKAALDAAIVTATANIAALIEDNNNGDITEQDVRDAYGNVLSVAQDVVDSSFNVIDDASTTKILHGRCNSDGTAASGFVFNGFSVSKSGVGQYTITHNLNSTNYSITTSLESISGNKSSNSLSVGSNSFIIRTFDGLSQTDTAFSFQMIINI